MNSFRVPSGDVPKQHIGDLRRRCRRREDAISRTAEKRLDFREVGKHLRKLSAVATVGIARTHA